MPAFKTIVAASVVACLASAKTIKITAKSDNTFDPDTVEAAEGDILEFHFEAKNHSVVAGDYPYPCSPLAIGTGFFSGFVETDDKADKVFQVTFNETDPIPFYSSQGDECAKGMVGIINPSDNMTLADYKERASALSDGVSPGTESFGGEMVDAEKEDSNSDSKEDDKTEDKADDKTDDSTNDSDENKDEDKEDAAGSLRVSVMGLLGAVTVAMLMV